MENQGENKQAYFIQVSKNVKKPQLKENNLPKRDWMEFIQRFWKDFCS